MSSSSSSSMLSLYVPIISKTTSEAYIKKMFNNNNIGKIKRVDFVKNIVKNRIEAFIHFEEWYNNKEATNLKEDILNNNTQTRFKYSNSDKFWPLLVNKNPEKTEVNPNYHILDSSEVNDAYKVSLNLTTNTKKPNNVKNKKSKEE